MKQQILVVKSNRQLNAGVWEIVFTGENLAMRAGQFVDITVEGLYLRRPMSVCDSSENALTVLYKNVGEGTKKMTLLKQGDKADVLTHLGNGFALNGVKKPLLIGGGIGCAPLYGLAREFAANGIKPRIILGFRNKDELYYKNEFEALGDVVIATDDGSCGVKGNAVCALNLIASVKEENPFDRYYACGPNVMLKAAQSFSVKGQLSLEARMGCGFGVCMGCSIKTTEGFKRVCKEGPVFDADTVLFE
jgi:dihydroorotate dehydrogenase electron transfer subunit